MIFDHRHDAAAASFERTGRRLTTFIWIFLVLAASSSAFQPLPISSAQRTAARQWVAASIADSDEEPKSTSVEFSMAIDDPDGELLLDRLEVFDSPGSPKRKQLKSLANLVVEWNDRINLVSRKDCTVPVVYGRHVLPCLATLGIEDPPLIHPGMTVVDVGTGGGFPGLPLAIAHPETEFHLIDSVGKKLVAIDDMAKRLGLTNVHTHHTRVEEWKGRADVVLGRSVAAIPKFCLWIQHLLQDDDALLLYMIGGEIDEDLLDQADFDVAVDLLLDGEGLSDKRILAFSRDNVRNIAANSGEELRVPNKPGTSKRSKNKNNQKKKKVKGAWAKRDPTAPKQRGYENFKRYDTLSQL